jgi:hypothetical protein
VPLQAQLAVQVSVPQLPQLRVEPEAQVPCPVQLPLQAQLAVQVSVPQ